MKKGLTLVLCLFLLATLQSSAQSYLGIQYNYMHALGDYGDNLTSSPQGLGLSFQLKPKVFKKVYFGVQTGISMYAMDSYDQLVRTEEDEYRELEIEEEDCFFSYSLTVRYFFVEDKLINPYLEARIGGMSFFSTKMTDEENDEYFDNSTTFHGTALQLGLGAGISYHIIDNLWLDFNVIYNKGSHTDYRDIGSDELQYRIDPEAGRFESYTGNVNYSLGVQFGF